MVERPLVNRRCRKMFAWGSVGSGLLPVAGLAMLGATGAPPASGTRPLAFDVDAGLPIDTAKLYADEGAKARNAPSTGGGRAMFTLDFESGYNPLYVSHPATFGLGFGIRSASEDQLAAALRFVTLSGAAVRAKRSPTGRAAESYLWGGVPLVADVDVFLRVKGSFRLGGGLRTGLYFAPRLYPLFAPGVGGAADLGNVRIDLMARLQPLPTRAEVGIGSGDELWAGSHWMVIPTLRLSLPLNEPR
jgi:hypothetical protein